MPDVSSSVFSSNQPVSDPTAMMDEVGAKSVLDILLAEQAISKQQYEDIKMKSATQGVSDVTLLQSSHIVGDDKIAQAQAKTLGIPYISLSSMSFSPQAIGFLSQAVVDRFSLIPFLYDDKTHTLSVAMSNPLDLDAIAFIRQKTGLIIKTYAASPSEVKAAIDQQYRQELVGEVGEAIKETEEYREQQKQKTVDSSQIAQLISDAPIAKIVSTILEYAVTSRASDVHIEPQEERVRVRYRIDGILYDKLSLPRNVADSLVSRIKILAELKIDERRLPQDGRFNFKVRENEVDLRVSTIPTVKGEKIVMRLLRKSGGIPTLPDLGLNGTALKTLENSILRPHGIILVCGPTGSGKTTTLYALLSRLNTTRINIVSLEDPVEYEVPGVNQVQINPAVGLTFASGLRSFLRQDPNVILVGEIRDKETTELAVQAALTGHLVFSTLHTSNAAGALPRLLDLGAEGFLLSSTVNAIVGQRIVRQICPHCRVAYAPPSQLVEQAKQVLGKLYVVPSEMKLYRGKGCKECGNLGYLGRIGIFEVMFVSEKIARLILEHADSSMIEQQAIAEGMITLKQDGYLKVLQGLTTIEEVLRVAQE
ncbi:MAG TPA: GspE/PulE family protein [Patescibacteria group bacterium]|nr:GspE/PulE family protein [Patescibacteria group bacterium]